jgi:hypothetical protein
MVKNRVGILSAISTEILRLAPRTTIYDWEIHKGRLEVFDEYGIRYIFY